MTIARVVEDEPPENGPRFGLGKKLSQETDSAYNYIKKQLQAAWITIKAVLDAERLKKIIPPAAIYIVDYKLKYPYHLAELDSIVLDAGIEATRIIHEFGHHLEHQMSTTEWASIVGTLRTEAKPRDILDRITLQSSNPPYLREPLMGENQLTGLKYYGNSYYSSGATEVIALTLEKFHLGMGELADDLDLRLALGYIRALFPDIAQKYGFGGA